MDRRYSNNNYNGGGVKFQNPEASYGQRSNHYQERGAYNNGGYQKQGGYQGKGGYQGGN